MVNDNENIVYLRPMEYAKIFGISKSTIYRKIKENKVNTLTKDDKLYVVVKNIESIIRPCFVYVIVPKKHKLDECLKKIRKYCEKHYYSMVNLFIDEMDASSGFVNLCNSLNSTKVKNIIVFGGNILTDDIHEILKLKANSSNKKVIINK